MDTTMNNKFTTKENHSPKSGLDNLKDEVFHYTCKSNFVEILKSFKLLPTCSELRAPNRNELSFRKNADGTVSIWDPSYEIKPVVWFTSDANARAEKHGLYGSCEDKTEFRIGLTKTDEFKSWKDFAHENNADAKWKRQIEKGRRPKTWYVHEGPIDLYGKSVSLYRKVNGEWVSLATHPEAMQW